jgi:tRNA(Arg) A34 adenosine deaminase TadA/6-pyruvoyl-tetrahydropterin synthase
MMAFARNPNAEFYGVIVARDRFGFSAAHLARRTDDSLEPLHGHNYAFSVEVTGVLDQAGYVLDFAVVKEIVADVAGALNQRTLLPVAPAWLAVEQTADLVCAKAFGRRYVFPSRDVTFVPVTNVTVECLAGYLAERIASHPLLAAQHDVRHVEVILSESSGQSARARAAIVAFREPSSATSVVKNGLFSPEDINWMRTALDAAADAVNRGQSPFAAVIVAGGRELARGTNETRSSGNPTRHAEIVALNDACSAGSNALSQSTLYSTCAPCPMCLAAAAYAGIGRVVYGSRLETARVLGSGDPPLPPELLVIMGDLDMVVVGGALETHADALLERALRINGSL